MYKLRRKESIALPYMLSKICSSYRDIPEEIVEESKEFISESKKAR